MPPMIECVADTFHSQYDAMPYTEDREGFKKGVRGVEYIGVMGIYTALP